MVPRFFARLCLAALLAGCGPGLDAGADALPEVARDIAGLEGATRTLTHPDVGLLRLPQRRICTGTLIAPRLVLTAAHCFAFTEATEPTELGTFDITARDGWTHPFKMVRVLVRTKDSADPSLDLAVAQLAEDVPGELARPFKLASSMPSRGTLATLYGYGCTDRTTQTGIGVKRRYSFRFGAATRHICPGDSGGPMLTQEKGIVAINMGFYRYERDVFASVPESHAWIVAAKRKLGALALQPL